MNVVHHDGSRYVVDHPNKLLLIMLPEKYFNILPKTLIITSPVTELRRSFVKTEEKVAADGWGEPLIYKTYSHDLSEWYVFIWNWDDLDSWPKPNHTGSPWE